MRQLDKAGQGRAWEGRVSLFCFSLATLYLCFYTMNARCIFLDIPFLRPPPTTSGVSHSSCLSLMTNFCTVEIFLVFWDGWRVCGVYSVLICSQRVWDILSFSVVCIHGGAIVHSLCNGIIKIQVFSCYNTSVLFHDLFCWMFCLI